MRNSMKHQVQPLLERGLTTARQAGATAAKLSFSQSESIGCEFDNGRLKTSNSRQSASYGVEVLAEGRRGSAGGNDLAELDEIIGRAVALAKAGAAAHFAAYPVPAETATVRRHSDRTLSLTRQHMVDGCQTIVDALKAYDPELYIEAGASRSESESLLVTSGGVRHAARGTHWWLAAGVQRTEGTDMLFANDHSAWRDRNEFYDPETISKRIVEDLRRGETIADAPSGTMPAYLPPEAWEMFLRPIVMGVNGRNVAKGDSPLRDRLGEQVLDPRITVVDDPHLDYCPGAARLDGNGVPTRVMRLFDAGVLKNFLYDLDTAGLAEAEPTGNDGCDPYSIQMLPGQKPSDELLAGIDDGIYIKTLLGFGQSNILNGDFSANVGLGYRIQRGEIVGRVKNTMVAGNIYELLRQGVQLSSDVDAMRRVPHGVIQGIHVSAANG